MSIAVTHGRGEVMGAVEHVEKKRRRTFNRSARRTIESPKWRAKQKDSGPTADELRRARKDRRRKRMLEKKSRRRNRG